MSGLSLQRLKEIYTAFYPQKHTHQWGLYVALLACLPVYFDLIISDQSRPFGYLASDSFYYFTVARNWAQTGLSSFDGTYLTNGYHPLWQWSLTLIYKVNLWLGLPEWSLLYTSIFLSVFFKVSISVFFSSYVFKA